MSAAPKSVAANQKKTLVGASLVTHNARIITLQEDITSIKELPNLPAHQRAARTQSRNWLEKIWPDIIDTIAGVISYANSFTSTYDTMKSLVPKLKQGDDYSKAQFSQLLSDLLKGIKQQKTKAAAVEAKIQAAHTSFQPFYAEFQADFNKADQILRKDNAELDKLVEERKDLKFHMGITMIKIGLSTKGMISAGYALFTASETGVGLLFYAIIVTASIVSLIEHVKEYAEDVEKLNDLTSRISALKHEVAQLHVIENQITELKTNTQSVVSATGVASRGWDTLVGDMEQLIKELNDISPQQIATRISTELKEANDEWNEVLTQAKALQPTGGQEAVTTTEYNTINALVAAVKK